MLGLVVATAIAEAFGASDLIVGVVLTVAAALTFGLLTVQYALFTAAITTYVVLLTDTLGEGALEADRPRLIGTALGIADRLSGLRRLAGPGGGERPQIPVLRPPRPTRTRGR